MYSFFIANEKSINRFQQGGRNMKHNLFINLSTIIKNKTYKKKSNIFHVYKNPQKIRNNMKMLSY